MTLPNAIALVFLSETTLLLALVCGLLWRRVRRLQATPGTDTAQESLTDLLDAEIASNAQRLRELADDDAEHNLTLRRALTARGYALETERHLLQPAEDQHRDECLLRTYAPAEAEDSESEVERLRRLLRREEQRVIELLGLRDAMRDLKLRFERLTKLAAQLTEPGLDGDSHASVVAEYGEAAAAYSGGFETVAGQLEALTESLECPPPTTDSGSLRSIIDQQAETITRLRERVTTGAPGDATEEIDRLGHQMAELEICVKVLQDENDSLHGQLHARGTETGPGDPDLLRQIDELTQALAMKDEQLRELKGTAPATD